VSNFVLPLYFTGTRAVDERGARNDFLGRMHGGRTLRSFGINPGGYVGFFDPKLGKHDTFAIQGDAIAVMRLTVKSQAREARRSMRYRNHEMRERLRQAAAKPGRAPAPREQLPLVAAIRPAVASAKVLPFGSTRTPPSGGRKTGTRNHRKSA
jgi:hypothetical protein